MGNFSSCSCSAGSRASRSAMLLDPCGDLRKLGLPVRAAELMLEYPGHLVSSLDRVRQTSRFIALRADDELLAGKAYVMVTCNRINARVTEDELEVIGSACKGRRQDRETGREIFLEEKDSNKGGYDLCGEGASGHHHHHHHQQQRFSSYRSHRPWNPVLEPIFENQQSSGSY